MPGPVPGIHVLLPSAAKTVDGWVKPGHNNGQGFASSIAQLLNRAIATPSRAN